MTDHKLFAGLTLCALFITFIGEAAASSTLGNPEVKARWTSQSPPPVEVVSATVLSCRPKVSPSRIGTDALLVEDAVIGPIPEGDWCDLRLVLEGPDGARQLLLIDIMGIDVATEALLWLDGAAVGSLSAELELLNP